MRILMPGQYLFRASIAFLVLVWCTGCAELETGPQAGPQPAPVPSGYWQGDGVEGESRIVVSISEQRAYYYKGKNLVGESTVSTGKPGFSTPPGHYKVAWKHADHVSTVFGDYVDDAGNVVKSNIDSRKDSRPPRSHYDGARMPFAMFFRGGYAMHQGYVPPYAASHGCIRLPAEMAEIFFNATPLGTPVIVRQEAVMRPAPAPVPSLASGPSTVVLSPPNLVRSTGPAPVLPSPVRPTTPGPATVAPPAPNQVRTTTPPPVRPGPVRSTQPGPATVAPPALNQVRTTTPPPVRPGPVRSTAPGPAMVAPPAPNQVRTTAPPPVRPGPVWSTASAPALSRTSVPQRSPAPPPLRSTAPSPLRSPGPAVSPAPATVSPSAQTTRSRKHKRTHSRRPTQAPAPASTPTQ